MSEQGGGPLVLTFDLGTQSARAMLVDPAGNILYKAQRRYETPYVSPQPDWAEQDPDFYWRELCAASRELKEKAGPDWARAIAVTLTCIRDTCVCVDIDGKPLRPAILWLDKREAHGLPRIPAAGKAAFAAIGMYESVKLQRRMSACNWIKVNQPEIWKKTHKFLMLSAYLNYRLTGHYVDSCANLIGHIPFDSKERRWMRMSDLRRCIFEVEPEKLYSVVEPGERIGFVHRWAGEQTGIPEGMELIATGSDKGCETLGLSCTGPDKAALSFGTTATVQVTTQSYMEPLPFIPAYPAVLKGAYNPEVQIYRGYWLVSWFKREFAAKEMAEARQKGVSAEQLLNRRLAEVPPGCEGLLFQPYFTPGIAMPTARGSIVGFRTGTPASICTGPSSRGSTTRCWTACAPWKSGEALRCGSCMRRAAAPRATRSARSPQTCSACRCTASRPTRPAAWAAAWWPLPPRACTRICRPRRRPWCV